jgi:hypothetical protein
MQQEIKLTNESSNTVFVDDVDVSNGVYYKNETLILFVLKYGSEFILTSISHDIKGDRGKSLLELIKESEWRSGNFYTIPDNKRIVTEREVTIDDLKNTDHVGFVTDNGEKGHIVYYDGKLQLISTVGPSMAFCNYTYGSDSGSNMADAILKNTSSIKVDKVYRFTTRKELYQWLAE